MITGFALILIFLGSIAVLLFGIIRLKVNPFLALLATAILTGVLVNMPPGQVNQSVASGFGNTLQGVGIVIGLGIILGKLLSESGVTTTVAGFLIHRIGEKRSPLAINLTGLLVSIPVFMDAAFVILIPLARKLSAMSRIPMITMATALSIGLIASHNIILPTPGPVEVANNFALAAGLFTLLGVVISLPAVLVGGWLYGWFMGKKYPRIEGGESAVAGVADRLPSIGLSLIVLLMPIVLILLGSVLTLRLEVDSFWHRVFVFLGNKNNALLISVFFALALLRRHLKRDHGTMFKEAAESAGMILLITGAGGAYAAVVNQSGIGNYLVETLASLHLSLLFTGFILAAILRAALGSSTVALVTASSILGPLTAGSGYSPVLVGLAVCAGGMCFSLPNDSGFWVVSRFSGLSVKETLQSWTVGSSLGGVIAFIVLLVLNQLFF
jgi:GntP family gluconate:H+ symporter